MSAAQAIACLVLGAGRSERFGSASKLEALLGGKPVGDHATDVLAEFRFVERVFVGRPGGFRPAASGFRVVETVIPDAGLGHSVATGVAALNHPDCESVMIALADMPLVTSSHVSELVRAYPAHANGVASAFGDAVSPPAILPLVQLRALADLDGDYGARALLKRAHRVAAPRDGLFDIDSPDDILRAEAVLSAGRTVQPR